MSAGLPDVIINSMLAGPVQNAMKGLRQSQLSTRLLLLAITLLAVGLVLSVPWDSVTSWGWDVLGTWGFAGAITLTGTLLFLSVAVPRAVAHIRHQGPQDRREPIRPIPMWVIWVGLLAVLLIGGVAAVLLVSVFGSGRPEDTVRLEAIKLAGTIAVGTGGIAALLLTARRQHTTEHDLLQKGHDANERRVTELYTAAAEQLASDKAPARMAGLYALERLGQANPDHQQTIINLFCAYLRMPTGSTESSGPNTFAHTHSSDNNVASGTRHVLLDLTPATAQAVGLSMDGAEQIEQDRQVRLTAQRLISQHLRPTLDGQLDNSAFWCEDDGSSLNLDLSGAAIEEGDFRDCTANHATFTGAKFIGNTRFEGMRFHGTAEFGKAKFEQSANFDGAKFQNAAKFDATHFDGLASFQRTDFQDATSFKQATFTDIVDVSLAHFHKFADFASTNFCDDAFFEETDFEEAAWFRNAQFYGDALFEATRFHGESRFEEATFYHTAKFILANFRFTTSFHEASFHKAASFDETNFQGITTFDGVEFQRTASFTSTNFGRASFNRVKFHGATWFDEANFSSHPSFMDAWVRLDAIPGQLQLPPKLILGKNTPDSESNERWTKIIDES